jgi:NADH-quinone oxidoreductase subunit C
MTDETKTPSGDEPTPDNTGDAPEPTADDTRVDPSDSSGEAPAADAKDETRPEADAPAESTEKKADDDPPAKPKLSDEEKAAKIAAAKAKAAAAKAAKEKADEAPKQPWEVKPAAPEHEDATGDPDVAALAATIDGSVLAADRYAGDVTMTVPRENIVDICRFLKEEQGYSFLVDLTAIDWPEREEGGRFDVVYWMHRFDDSKRIRVLTAVPESEPIASVTAVWKTANWLERETYDMFGITFDGHPGLERILTWEGFNGHPLRKDFPVEGIDTGAAIYPDVYPPGGGPVREEELQKPEPKPKPKPKEPAPEETKGEVDNA